MKGSQNKREHELSSVVLQKLYYLYDIYVDDSISWSFLFNIVFHRLKFNHKNDPLIQNILLDQVKYCREEFYSNHLTNRNIKNYK